MKILHVVNHLDHGGVEKLLVQVLPLLAQAGIEVELFICTVRQRALLNELAQLGIPIHYWGGSPVYHWRHIVKIAKLLRGRTFDVVHLHLFPSMLYVLAALWSVGQRPAVIFHEHNTTNGRRHRLLWLLDWWMYRQADRVVCISPATLEALDSWLPGIAEKSIIIPNGIALKEGSELRYSHRHPTARAGSLRVFSAGRCVSQKGFDVLIRAVASIDAVTLEIAGEGPQRKDLEYLVADLGVGERVSFLGARNDVPSLLGRAEAYVQSSRWEGFGIAALEALGCGLPTIISDVPGMSEMMGDTAGLRFKSEDSQDLARQLVRLRDDLPLREMLCREAMERARHFSIEESVRRLVELYRELVSGVAPVICLSVASDTNPLPRGPQRQEPFRVPQGGRATL